MEDVHHELIYKLRYFVIICRNHTCRFAALHTTYDMKLGWSALMILWHEEANTPFILYIKLVLDLIHATEFNVHKKLISQCLHHIKQETTIIDTKDNIQTGALNVFSMLW